MPRPVSYDESLRIALIGAAADSIVAGGVEALSLRAVAAASGTSTSAIYTFFGSKSGLIEAVLVEAERSFGESQRQSPVSDDVAADLLALGAAYREWALANRSLYTVMFGGRLPFGGLSSDADASILPLQSAVNRGLDSGVIRPAPADVIVLSIWASVHGFVALEIAACDPAPRGEAYALHLKSLLDGWQV